MPAPLDWRVWQEAAGFPNGTRMTHAGRSARDGRVGGRTDASEALVLRSMCNLSHPRSALHRFNNAAPNGAHGREGGATGGEELKYEFQVVGDVDDGFTSAEISEGGSIALVRVLRLRGRLAC